MYDFANILFSGPCNARCPFCIGRQIDPQLNRDSLDLFPLPGLDRFVDQVRRAAVPQLVFSGTNTDPLLYRHMTRLLAELRAALPAATRFALHTNGRLALRKIELVNRFDRVCLSLPSFRPATYRELMGVGRVPDLSALLRQAVVPVKISCIVTDANCLDIPDFLLRCVELGIHRVVLRKLVGERRSWQELIERPVPQSRLAGPTGDEWEDSIIRVGPGSTSALQPTGSFRGNRIYNFQGLEVTLWDFDRTECRALNLFSNGEIRTAYHLLDTPSAER